MDYLSLRQSILNTTIYFDIFDYPLTAMEIFQWLYANYGLKTNDYRLSDVLDALESSQYLKDRIATQDGFYFLKWREAIVQTRLKRYNLAQRKFKRLLWVSKFFSYFPFIQMTAVCNTLAYNNTKDESDIDLFIVAKENRTWLVRFLTVSFLTLIRLRPKPYNLKDKICLSFFVDEKNLDLKKFAMTNDIYLPYWIAQLVPVYQREDIFRKFLSQNKWIKETISNHSKYNLNQARLVKNIFSTEIVKRIFEFINDQLLFNLPSYLVKKYQNQVLPDHLRAMANKDTRVVINDGVLKFHDNDSRERYWKIFEQKVGILK